MRDARVKPTISLESEAAALQRTLRSSYSPVAVIQAGQRQDDMLVQRLRNGSCMTAGIGCVDGYHAVLPADVPRGYHGFEVSAAMVAAARELCRREGIANAGVFVGDTAVAALPEVIYDIVRCLYLTPGNILDQSTDLGLYNDTCLDRRPCFLEVFSRFHRAMKGEGRIFLAPYKDVLEAEAAQIDLYDGTGQRIVTPAGSRFVVTAEGLLCSVRWTQNSLLPNLDGCGIRRWCGTT